MEKMEKNNGFIITCISCIVLLLTLTYFGVNNSVKKTHSALPVFVCSSITEQSKCNATTDCSWE